MEPFKNIFNENFFKSLSAKIKKGVPSFPKNDFDDDAISSIKELELMDRIRLVATLVNKYFPGDYRQIISFFRRITEENEGKENGFPTIFIPEYIGRFGLDDFDYSLDQLAYFTQFSSSEFGIRPYLKQDLTKTIEKMIQWSKDTNYHVRRLSSEGSRPRLPWGIQIKELINNPEPVRTILDNLRTDDSEYVRKSVANHLNDISKDNPVWMLDLLESWDQNNKKVVWITRHATRTLVKKGDPRTLALFGFTRDPQLSMGDIRFSKSKINIGDNVVFLFSLNNESNKPVKLVIDYIVHYIKKTGKLSPKIFKLKQIELKPDESTEVRKNHSFIDVSIRKHFPGVHKLEVQINGKIVKTIEFELLDSSS